MVRVLDVTPWSVIACRDRIGGGVCAIGAAVHHTVRAAVVRTCGGGKVLCGSAAQPVDSITGFGPRFDRPKQILESAFSRRFASATCRPFKPIPPCARCVCIWVGVLVQYWVRCQLHLGTLKALCPFTPPPPRPPHPPSLPPAHAHTHTYGTQCTLTSTLTYTTTPRNQSSSHRAKSSRLQSRW